MKSSVWKFRAWEKPWERIWPSHFRVCSFCQNRVCYRKLISLCSLDKLLFLHTFPGLTWSRDQLMHLRAFMWVCAADRTFQLGRILEYLCVGHQGSCIHSQGTCSPLCIPHVPQRLINQKTPSFLGPRWYSGPLRNVDPLLWPGQLSWVCVQKLV